jgi:tetratricopeptide (TPR) repeat protein
MFLFFADWCTGFCFNVSISTWLPPPGRALPRTVRVIPAYKIDDLYDEQAQLRGGIETDRRIAVEYLAVGKERASQGNRAGFVESIGWYKMALELAPDFSTAYAEMGYSYASIALILRETESDADSIDQYLKSARRCIDQARRINENNPTVYASDAILHYYMNQKNEARETLKRAEEVAKKEGFTDRVLLAMAIVAGDKNLKVSCLERAVEIDPDNAELHNLLGISYYCNGDNKRAGQMFERAARLSPGYGKPYLNLALIHPGRRSELHDEALKRDKDVEFIARYLTRVIRIKQRVGVVLSALGLMWLMMAAGVPFGMSERDREAHERGCLVLLTPVVILLGCYGTLLLITQLRYPLGGIAIYLGLFDF